MATFSIRPLGALDLDLASSLHGAAFAPWGERAWTRLDFGELLAKPGVMGLVAEQDGEEMGFALCRLAANEAELLTIAVRADVRRLGAGRALLDAMIEHLREFGAAALFLEVGVDNQAANSLYRQAGFQVVGRRPGYYARATGHPAADALIMRLFLRPAG